MIMDTNTLVPVLNRYIVYIVVVAIHGKAIGFSTVHSLVKRK